MIGTRREGSRSMALQPAGRGWLSYQPSWLCVCSEVRGLDSCEIIYWSEEDMFRLYSPGWSQSRGYWLLLDLKVKHRHTRCRSYFKYKTLLARVLCLVLPAIPWGCCLPAPWPAPCPAPCPAPGAACTLPTSAPPCTTFVVVRIIFAWCHSLLEFNISPLWVEI